MKTNHLLAACVATLCAFNISARVHASAVQYTVTDLGLLGQAWGVGLGINASGQVVGYVSPYLPVRATNNYQAIRWTGTTATVLNGLGGPDNKAIAINDSGQVTGADRVPGPINSFLDPYYHAVRVTGTTAVDLGTLGGSASIGVAINASGQVAGWSDTTGNRGTHAVRWTGTTATDLATLGGTASYAYGINASGQVAGYSFTSSYNDSHAVRWTGTTPTDLGAGDAYGINDSGQVVGSATSTRHATVWTGTTPADLGVLAGDDYSAGLGINASGDVLGWSFNATGTAVHPFIYLDGTMYDLMSLLIPGSNVTSIDISSNGGNGINDSDQIAASAMIDGQWHAIRLDPVAVPEPVSVLLATGSGAMLVLRRRRA